MNITSLVGNSGGRATLTTTAKGVKIANFSLATVKRYKDREGVQKKITDWHNVAVFGPQADVVAKYVDKGTVICVTGTLHNKAYTDKAGNPQVSSTLHADFFEIMSSGKKATAPETPAPAPKSEAPPAPSIGSTCPKCNKGTFIKKTFKNEDFLACNQYPDCKNMIKIKK
jgi:single-strand DNA-binding protein